MNIIIHIKIYMKIIFLKKISSEGKKQTNCYSKSSWNILQCEWVTLKLTMVHARDYQNQRTYL